MSSTWETVRLSEVCVFENGDRGKNYPGRKAFVTEGVPFINAGHLSENGICKKTMNYIPNERFDLLGSGKVQEGDILFCLRGSLGKFAVVEDIQKGAIASSLVIVRPNSAKINKYFLSAYFGSRICADMISKYKNGAAQPNLSAKSLGLFEIPLPPLPEQKRIVAILDKTFEGINQAVEGAEKNLANGRELFESYLNTIFTRKGEVEMVPLSDLTTDITDGDHSAPPKVSEGIPFITISNINKDTREIDFFDTFKVPGTYYKKLKEKRKPRTGDVLFTVTGSYGIPVIVKTDKKFCFQRHIALLRPKPSVDSSWLYYALLSPLVYRQATDGATGTAQKTVGLKVLRNILVPKMSSLDQKKTVKPLDSLWNQTQHLQSIYNQKLSALQELKQSILQKAFSGELTASN